MKHWIHISLTATLLLTLSSCRKDCSSVNPSCDLERESGPCEALFIKYYYDKDDKKCKSFEWGGCDGVVPFDTMEECRQCECK